MRKIKRFTPMTVVASVVVLGGLLGAGSPVAAAAVGKPKPMRISATGGDGTTITDSVQGKASDSVQGIENSDTALYRVTRSEEATVQDKAPNKMTKK